MPDRDRASSYLAVHTHDGEFGGRVKILDDFYITRVNVPSLKTFNKGGVVKCVKGLFPI